MKNPAGIRRRRRGLSCFHLWQGCCTWLENARSLVSFRPDVEFFAFPPGAVPPKPSQKPGVISSIQVEEVRMRKALAILATVATVGATTISAPAEARGLGPGLAFGLAAGAIVAGVAGAYGPYYYGPGYGYYAPRYYSYYGPPAYYGPGPYAYYGGPYYRHRHWRHW